MADSRKIAQMGLNRMCDGCHGNAPEVYCACTGNRIYLCKSCIGDHIGKYLGPGHELIPADVDVSNMSVYRERKDALIMGKRDLEQNLERIDQCCEELIDAVEKIVWTLTEYLNSQLSQLHALKATLSEDITKSVSETQSTLAQDAVQFTEKYSQYLRQYEKDNLVLFNYKINPYLDRMCLRQMPNFALLSPGQYRNPFVRLKSDQVMMLNFQNEKWSPPIRLSNVINIDEHSMYTRVDMSRVFCCGSFQERVTSMNQADYLIDFNSGIVETLLPLKIARREPGVTVNQLCTLTTPQERSRLEGQSKCCN